MSVVEPASGPGLSARPLAITGILVLIVLSMVIPIPAAALDVGIALSIATATLILVMASLVERPTDFQAFPVLLLVSLLIRLSLNISSTRLILTNGQNGPTAAGHVINGFAEFVAGGSLLVGLTVFGVISVVNFMVITKGSGRMAEVSARFALDSLPGKQLAIDGDLNSGAIDHDEAKRRRIREQRVVRAQPVEGCGITLLVDDVAVTGRTLQAAAGTVDGGETIRIGVGMVWNSRRLRRRLEAWPLTTGVTYSQKGGGVPAMNTLRTMAEKPEVAADYVARRLRGDTRFLTILDQYKEAV